MPMLGHCRRSYRLTTRLFRADRRKEFDMFLFVDIHCDAHGLINHVVYGAREGLR